MRRTPLLVIAGVVVVLALAVVAFGVVLAVARPSSTSAASVAPTPSTVSWPRPGAIAWRACKDTQLTAAGAQCASVTVPMDWSAPRDGRTVSIAISRVRHTATPYVLRF